MDSFELNKIIAAILMVALLIIGIGKLSNIIFHVEKPETPGYSVEVEQATVVSSQTTSEPTEDKIDIATVNKLFDDISDLEAELRKSEFNRNLEIRSLLDDEQEMRFERLMQRKKMMEKNKIM